MAPRLVRVSPDQSSIPPASGASCPGALEMTGFREDCRCAELAVAFDVGLGERCPAGENRLEVHERHRRARVVAHARTSRALDELAAAEQRGASCYAALARREQELKRRIERLSGSLG